MGTGILITTDLTFLAEASENLHVAGLNEDQKRVELGGGDVVEIQMLQFSCNTFT